MENEPVKFIVRIPDFVGLLTEPQVFEWEPTTLVRTASLEAALKMLPAGPHLTEEGHQSFTPRNGPRAYANPADFLDKPLSALLSADLLLSPRVIFDDETGKTTTGFLTPEPPRVNYFSKPTRRPRGRKRRRS